MKAAVVFAALFTCSLAASLQAADETPPATPAVPSKEKIGVAIGLTIGANIKETFGADVDVETVCKGLREAYSDKQSMTPAEVQEANNAIQTMVQERQAAERKKRTDAMKKMGDEAKPKGEDFLAANKKKEGVQTTASGLQYKVITEGTGEPPKATDTVVVNYKGTFIDGTEFDSSFKHGKPALFPVNRVIPGWTEGLQLMKPGSKYQFVIPSNLAYGENPPPGSEIPPNSVLVFEVELISVNGPANSPKK
jgi:FKBP-type peptidyl-prolyl cis-trans isomerase